MFEWLTRFLAPATGTAEAVPFPSATGGARVAVCALLLELAHTDGEVSPAEHIHIGRAVREQFGLGLPEAEELLDRAARLRGKAVRLAQLTSCVLAKYSQVQIAVLVEIMWSLVHIDGHLAPEEGYLLRKLCFLLRCEPLESFDRIAQGSREIRGKTSAFWTRHR